MGKQGKVTLELVNARLKAARIGLAVIQRGNKLSLRGTLPPKPGSNKAKPHQQIISLGIYANPSGLLHAEAKALEFGSLIAQQRFSWIAVESNQNDADSCAVWVEAFKRYAFQNLISQTGEKAELSWRNRFWYPAFSKLDPKADLTADEIVRAVQQTKPNSRSRQVCCQKMKKLAEFSGIDVDLKPYQGNYNPKEIQREVPTDSEIEDAIDAMPNSEWQWIAAMMATYGLRDHECWFTHLAQEERDGHSVWMCEVIDGKTGARKSIPPLPPEWPERWKLYEERPPQIKVRTNKEYGDRTARAFDRQKNPHKPYSYRHAFAIRAALKYGFPTAVAAKWMGHDPSVYLSTYQKHISASQATDTFFDKLV